MEKNDAQGSGKTVFIFKFRGVDWLIPWEPLDTQISGSYPFKRNSDKVS